MKAFIHSLDATLTTAVRRLPRSFDPFFIFVTQLGDPIVVCAIALGVGVWALMERSVRLCIAAAAIPATLVIGYGLKLIFERSRPMLDLGYSLRLDSFSFPSGHTSGSTIAYGLLAYLISQLVPGPWNIVVVIALLAVPVLVGVSRVYLGVHYPSDVIAGWILGLCVLAVVVFVVRPIL